MKVLVAIDLSESSDIVIKSSLKTISKLSEEIYLLHVADPEPEFIGFEYGPKSSRVHLKEKIQKERKKLKKYADKYSTENMKLIPITAQGSTAETILEEAKKLGCSILIIGSHGRGALRHLLVGSVSEAILRNSDIPILIVPTR